MLIKAGRPYMEELAQLGAIIFESGADLAQVLAGDSKARGELVSKLHGAKRSARERLRQLLAKLNRARIKPLDENIVRNLAVMQYELMRRIARSADCFLFYRIGEAGPFLPQIAQQLRQQARLIGTLIAEISNGNGDVRLCEGIIRLDSDVKIPIEEGVAHLFGSEHDPLEVIKWKGVFDSLGNMTEQCRRIAEFVKLLVPVH
jgi:uncharacterized protein Yka (UPF0111/DUF47 family)